MRTEALEISTVASLGSSRLPARYALIILVYGSSLLLVGLDRRVLTRHEVLAAQPAREMLAGGGKNWIVPMFAGIPRTAKPPTTGWLIAASMAIFRSEAEWVVRLPSVLSAVAAALIMAYFAARHFGAVFGLLTGMIQVTCYYTIMQGRLSEADMPACAAVAGAMVCFGLGVLGNADKETRRQGDKENRNSVSLSPCPLVSFSFPWTGVAFYCFWGLAFLLKVVPAAFVGLAVAAYLAVRRERRVVRFLANPLGIAIFLVCVLAWPVAAYRAYPPILDSWWFELHGTASGQLSRDSIFTYLGTIPYVLLPWTPAMAFGAWIAFQRGRHRRPLGQFLLCWFIPGVVALHFSAMKSKHYPMPMLPPMAMVGAGGVMVFFRWDQEKTRGQGDKETRRSGVRSPCLPVPLSPCLALIAGCAIAAVCVKLIVPRYAEPAFVNPLLVIIGLVALGGVLWFYMEHRRSALGRMIVFFATFWAVVAMVEGVLIPLADDYKTETALARRANVIVPAGQTVYLLNLGEAQIVFYLRPPARRFEDADQFNRFLSTRSGETYAFMKRGDASALASRFHVDLLDQKSTLGRKETEADRMVLARLRS